MKPIYIGLIVLALIVAAIFLVNALLEPAMPAAPGVETNLAAVASLPALADCDLAQGGPISDEAWRECEQAAQVLLDSSAVKEAEDPEVVELRQQIAETLQQLEAMDPSPSQI